MLLLWRLLSVVAEGQWTDKSIGDKRAKSGQSLKISALWALLLASLVIFFCISVFVFISLPEVLCTVPRCAEIHFCTGRLAGGISDLALTHKTRPDLKFSSYQVFVFPYQLRPLFIAQRHSSTESSALRRKHILFTSTCCSQ